MDIINLFAVEIYGDGSFHPGEVIYGDVYLKATDELTLREIRVEFYGEAKVNWTETAKSGRVRKRLGFLDYTNDEHYLNIAVTVYGKAPGQSGPNPVLNAGEHSFPFEFRLPEENLPSTFVGKNGYVKYWLKAILDRPWKDDKAVAEAFTVLERVDVNQAEFLCPSQIQEDRTMGCLCCVSGPLNVTVRTDRSAYCKGELMTVTVYANNQTSYSILGVELELVQDTIYIASGGKRTFTNEILTNVTKAGKASSTEGNDFFDMVPMLIPSTTPTMKSCRCIKISYQVKFTLLLRGTVNFRVFIPITIGSIQGAKSAGKGSTPSPSVTFMGLPSTSMDETDGFTLYPGEAPPTYAESVRGQTRRYDAVYFNNGTLDMPQFSSSVRERSKDETSNE